MLPVTTREPEFVPFSLNAFQFMTLNKVLNHHSVLCCRKLPANHQGAESVDGEKMTAGPDCLVFTLPYELK